MPNSNDRQLSADERGLYDNIVRSGHSHTEAGNEVASRLKELGLITIADSSGAWILSPVRFIPGFLTRDEAVKAGRAFFAQTSNVLGVEGSDFHVVKREGDRWHFEAARDPATN